MTSATANTGSPIRTEVIAVFGVIALALMALVYVLSQRQQDLRSSPVGLDGLQIWLTAERADAQSFSGGWLLDADTIGLLVVPLHDSQPDRELVSATTKEELLFQQDEADISWRVILEKLDRAPGLVVLPKWRSGMRLTGIAHPALLIDAGRVDAILQRLTGLPAITTSRSRRVFTALPYTDASGTQLQTEIYAAQLFDGSGCDPLIGSGDQTLLASCPLAGSDWPVLVLSDPDLINNHGLRLGQNATIARDVLTGAAGGAGIVIDYSRDNWFADPEAPPQRDRTWGDLLRFFEPPFLALWLGSGILLALVLWRSLRRVGPVAREDIAGVGKMQAVRARARLMRLTGQDGALVADYAQARIAATAARLVGPGQARQIGEEGAFQRYVGRRSRDLATRLEAVLTRLHALPPAIPTSAAIRHVDDLEQILELIANDP